MTYLEVGARFQSRGGDGGCDSFIRHEKMECAKSGYLCDNVTRKGAIEQSSFNDCLGEPSNTTGFRPIIGGRGCSPTHLCSNLDKDLTTDTRKLLSVQISNPGTWVLKKGGTATALS